MSLLYWDVVQCWWVVCCWYTRSTYCSHMEGWSSLQKFLDCLTACPLKIGPVHCPETFVTGYKPTLKNIPEDQTSSTPQQKLKISNINQCPFTEHRNLQNLIGCKRECWKSGWFSFEWERVTHCITRLRLWRSSLFPLVLCSKHGRIPQN